MNVINMHKFWVRPDKYEKIMTLVKNSLLFKLHTNLNKLS